MSLMQLGLLVWGLVTAALTVLLIYRAMISMKEDDQLFLDSSGTSMQAEQTQVQLRLRRLSPYIKILGGASGALLVTIGSLWAYHETQARGLFR